MWRGRIGEPKNSRSKATVPLIPQLQTLLEQHRKASGSPASGPIFANGAGKALDLDSLYRRQMKEPLKQAGIEWEVWHGFRRGLATNLERIGVRETIAAMILRHANTVLRGSTISNRLRSKRSQQCADYLRRSRLLKVRNCSPTAPQRLLKMLQGQQTGNGCSDELNELNVRD